MSRQVEFYVREIESMREHHCAKVLAEARKRAGEILRPAFQNVRSRVRGVLTEERKLLEKKVQAAEAGLRTLRLQRLQRRQARLFRLAYEDLLQILAKRWTDPKARREWVMGLLDSGLARFPRGGWEIRHPEDWSVEEIEVAGAYLRRQGIDSPAFSPDSGLSAGLRIHFRGVVLDASVAGLISDRRHIEARLLALVNGQGAHQADEQRIHSMD